MVVPVISAVLVVRLCTYVVICHESELGYKDKIIQRGSMHLLQQSCEHRPPSTHTEHSTTSSVTDPAGSRDFTLK